jgi:Ni/Co efflux regulator RcnB
MKKLVLIMAVVAFTAGSITAFGQTPDKQAVKARENLKEEKKDVVVAKKELNTAKIDSVSDYQKLTKEADIKFKSNEKCVADLRAAIIKSNSKDKVADEKKVSIMEAKNTSLKKELADYKVSGQKEFSTFKSRLDKDLSDLAKELKDFKVS